MDDVTYRDKILISNYTIECLHSQNLLLFRTMQWNVYIFTENQKTYFFLSVGKFPENSFFCFRIKITPLTNPENEISTAHIPEFRDIPEKWHVCFKET